MSDRKPTRPPGLRVPSDDCAIVVDGVTYTPHHGEYVTFATCPEIASMDLQRRLRAAVQQLTILQAVGVAEGPPWLEALDALLVVWTDIFRMLARTISAWTWTDHTGEPYPSPPSADDLLRLTAAEAYYLLMVSGWPGARTVPAHVKEASV